MKIPKPSASVFNVDSRHELNIAFWMMIRTYKFDETGFPGNRKRVIPIECIITSWRALPPFIIFEDKVHLEAWYRENLTIPPNWAIAVNGNGWTINWNFR